MGTNDHRRASAQTLQGTSWTADHDNAREGQLPRNAASRLRRLLDGGWNCSTRPTTWSPAPHKLRDTPDLGIRQALGDWLEQQGYRPGRALSRERHDPPLSCFDGSRLGLARSDISDTLERVIGMLPRVRMPSKLSHAPPQLSTMLSPIVARYKVARRLQRAASEQSSLWRGRTSNVMVTSPIRSEATRQGQALAAHVASDVTTVDTRHLASPWQGHSVRQLRKYFSTATQMGDAVIVLLDVDRVFDASSALPRGLRSLIRAQLRCELQQLAWSRPGFPVICTGDGQSKLPVTGSATELPEATLDERIDMLARAARDLPTRGPLDLVAAARRAEGLTLTELEACYVDSIIDIFAEREMGGDVQTTPPAQTALLSAIRRR